jgi:hypothetical protein
VSLLNQSHLLQASQLLDLIFQLHRFNFIGAGMKINQPHGCAAACVLGTFFRIVLFYALGYIVAPAGIEGIVCTLYDINKC